MAYDSKLADRIRKYLSGFDNLQVEEKKMFGGLAFMINGKMCVNASGENLMCRFDPGLDKEISQKLGYKKMVMKGKEYKGYCYVKPIGFRTQEDFENWVDLCLDFNKFATSSKK
jgi:TfoX/Sxy family transcriptional regulator of competence genes